jgi:hypothetical protein
MPELKCQLSTGLWNHLQEYSKWTEHPVTHIVSKALDISRGGTSCNFAGTRRSRIRYLRVS